MKKIVLLVALIGVFSACKKSTTPPPVVTPPTSDTGQYGTPFTGVPDPKDIVMYEVNIRAFSPSDNFTGVEARMDSIKALGVNVIWLMPIYPVGQVKSFNSPYCIKNDTEVNPEFGTLTDLRNFVSMAHTKGMAVILDWVTDGTSWDNIWIDSTSWYNLSGGMIQQYPGYSDVAALNYSNKSVWAAQIHGMEYWLLQANVDGFRCDNADSEPDAFWTTAISNISTLNHKLILLAEGSSTTHFASGFQMIYANTYYTKLNIVFDANYSAQTLTAENATENAGTTAGTYMLRFTSNHDKDANNTNGDGTPDSLFGGSTASPAGAMAAFVECATMGGVPLIYDGQEVGCNIFLNFFSTSTLIDWSANNSITVAYEQVIAFRNANDAVKEGSITDFSSTDVSAFERTSGSNTVLVLINVRNAAKSFTVPAALANTTWTDAVTNTTVTLDASGTTVSLSSYQYMLLTKQ